MPDPILGPTFFLIIFFNVFFLFFCKNSRTIIDSLLYDAFEKNCEMTCTVFLDLAKAFDSVDHEILLKKLEIYGIRGSALQLLRSYLSQRKHLTRVGGVDSELLTLRIGVPQGSILGPLLFLIFIKND